MLDKYLFQHVGKAKIYIVNSVIMMMLRVLGTAMIALSFGLLIEQLYFAKELSFLKITGLFFVGLFVRVFSLYKVTKYQSNIIGEVKAKLRKKLITKAMSIGPNCSEFSTSHLITMGSDTIEQLENYYGRFLPQYYGCYGASLVTFVIFLCIDVRIALLFLLLMPIIPLFLKFMLSIVGKMQKKYWGKYQDLAALFLDSLQGITTLKIFRADKKRAEELDKSSEDFRKQTMKILAMQLNSITLIEWIAYGSSIACILMSFYVFTKTNIALSFLLMILFLAMEAFRPMITLTSSFHVAMTGVAAGKSLIEFLALEEDTNDGKFPSEIKSIKAKALSFVYPSSEKKALDSIDIEVFNKGYVSIVGESGCGKSTLAKILSGHLRTNEACISVNDLAYSKINSSSIAKNVLRISHDAHIFEGTVAENLKMANENISQEEIKSVLEKVNLYDEIISRGGLDMLLLSGGLNISGGQRQRLALARAMLYKPLVYIFDEATSNIDIESEEIILKNIKELAKEKSVVMVSHRLSSIKDSDCIYVMHKGKIIEKATHDALMKLNGEYKRIYDAQSILEGDF